VVVAPKPVVAHLYEFAHAPSISHHSICQQAVKPLNSACNPLAHTLLPSATFNRETERPCGEKSSQNWGISLRTSGWHRTCVARKFDETMGGFRRCRRDRP